MNIKLKKIIVKLLLVIFGLSLFLIPHQSSARDINQISDWYIKDFRSDIVVNTDSSLDITENIIADCGNLPGKHGIYRILPLFYQKASTQRVKTPVSLKSITDFNGQPYDYEESRSRDAVVWKIGDPNKTVTGINNYKIVYEVKNAIRFDDANLDEFYWNLTGNFWQIDVDAAAVTLRFPSAITQSNSNVVLYTGLLGQKDTDATSTWLDENTLQVISTKGMRAGESITASVTFPKNIITPYVPSWFEKYGSYLWLFLPLLTFMVCFSIWQKFGRDPKLGKTVIAEYEPPEGMTPMEMDIIMHNRSLKNSAISAAIVNLAVKKIIKIEEIPRKGIFGKKDFKLTLLEKNFEDKSISDSEKYLLNCLFFDNNQDVSINYIFNKTSKDIKADKEEILLSSLQNKFYSYIPPITNLVKREKNVADSFNAGSFTLKWVLIGIGSATFIATIIFSSFYGVATGDAGYPLLSGITSAIIILFFAFLMPQLTLKGAELQWKIKGFRLYMETAEKYREQFNEKENIFEKYLPYAMVFGIVGLWIEKMKMIYGENYFNTYHPLWYAGYIGSFNADTFADSINEVSSSMAATLASSPSSSGSGGGGFSGGGGGGGGGGGW